MFSENTYLRSTSGSLLLQGLSASQAPTDRFRLGAGPDKPGFAYTVPVEAAYQIWRVAKVLSMGKVHTHI